MVQEGLHCFSRDTLRAMPWKNGGGSTREVACWPKDAGLHDFDWRVSIARIEADGPFSRFEGIDRSITLLDGPGVHLHAQDGSVDHRLDTHCTPFAFAGEAAIDARLLGGPSDDFNVMTRRGRACAQVRVLRAAADLPEAAHGVLLAVQGSWRACGIELKAGHGLWWADAPLKPTLAPLADNAILLAVRIVPHAS